MMKKSQINAFWKNWWGYSSRVNTIKFRKGTDQCIIKKVFTDTMAHTINRLMASVLTKREEGILRLRLGLEDGTFWSLPDIAFHFGISIERVRYICFRSMEKLSCPSGNALLQKAIDDSMEYISKPLGIYHEDTSCALAGWA